MSLATRRSFQHRCFIETGEPDSLSASTLGKLSSPQHTLHRKHSLEGPGDIFHRGRGKRKIFFLHYSLESVERGVSQTPRMLQTDAEGRAQVKGCSRATYSAAGHTAGNVMQVQQVRTGDHAGGQGGGGQQQEAQEKLNVLSPLDVFSISENPSEVKSLGCVFTSVC